MQLYPNSEVVGSKPFCIFDYSKEFQECEYTRGCHWSPDGTCILIVDDKQKFQLFNLPSIFCQGNLLDKEWFSSNERINQETKPALVIKENDSLYDYAWFPGMVSSDPVSSCFITSCMGLPIHLWDAWTGELRASYSPYNHLDELVSAYAIEFSADGCSIIGGYDKSIRIFNTNVPGKVNQEIQFKKQISRISSIASHTELSQIVAGSSYNGDIGLFSINSNRLFCILKGHKKAITHMKFSKDGTKLFSATRNDDEIICWDIRNPGDILRVFKREKNNNQRIRYYLSVYRIYRTSREGNGSQRRTRGDDRCS